MARFGHAASVAAMTVALATSVGAQEQTTYKYDVFGRLIEVNRPSVSTVYTYDDADNRKQLTVTAGNGLPVAQNDGFNSAINVAPGGSVSFNPLSNDTDPDSDNFYLTNVSGWDPSKANSVPFVANCLRTAASCVTYNAKSGQISGFDTFSYAIADGKGGTANGTIKITINAAPLPPATSPSTTTVAGNYTGSVNTYPVNLIISGGTPTSLNITSAPANGTPTVSGTNISFTPTSGWSGQTSLQYTASNSAGTSSPTTATINVTPVVGVIHTDAIGGQWNAIALAPKTNYTSLTLTGNPQKGSAYISGSTLYYNPLASQAGSGDLMTYQATNGSLTSNYGQVWIDNITAAPNRNPYAGTDSVTIGYNTYAYFDPRTNDSDPDGDPLTLVSVTAAQHGSTWTNSNNYVSYVPNQGWSGSDYFYYTISDGKGGTGLGLVLVDTNPPPPNNAPTANTGTTDPVWQSTTVYVDPTTNDTDPDGDALTIQSIDSVYCAYGQINGVSTCPSSNGSVSRSGNTLIYNAPFLSYSGTPGSNYAAIVVWYTINDGHGHTAQSYQIFNVYGPQ